jgi:hypothetical protein
MGKSWTSVLANKPLGDAGTIGRPWGLLHPPSIAASSKETPLTNQHGNHMPIVRGDREEHAVYLKVFGNVEGFFPRVRTALGLLFGRDCVTETSLSPFDLGHEHPADQARNRPFGRVGNWASGGVNQWAPRSPEPIPPTVIRLSITEFTAGRPR